jgi:hypothetical protein
MQHIFVCSKYGNSQENSFGFDFFGWFDFLQIHTHRKSVAVNHHEAKGSKI